MFETHEKIESVSKEIEDIKGNFEPKNKITK